MPLNGSGTYTAPANSWNPAVTTTTINSTDWNSLLADITTALSTALYKDGQQTATAIIPFADGITLAGGSTLANYVAWTSYTPTVTLNGTGTVPQYTTNSGRYSRIGSTVFVEIYLTGDGGSEGSGVGQINIAVPIAVSGSFAAAAFPIGFMVNSAAVNILYGNFTGGGSVIALQYFDTISTLSSVTADQQNNTTRTIRAAFFYEV